MKAYNHYKEAISVYCAKKPSALLSNDAAQAYIGAAKACLLFYQCCDVDRLQGRTLMLQLADDAIVQGVAILRSNHQQLTKILLVNAFECRRLICSGRASMYEKRQQASRLTSTSNMFRACNDAESSSPVSISNASTSNSFK